MVVTDSWLIVSLSSMGVVINAVANILDIAPSIGSAIILAMPLTIVIEVLVSLAYVAVTRKSRRILIYVVLANLISVPILWIVVSLFENLGLGFLGTMEVLVVIFEACFVYGTNKTRITLRQSFLLSILMNLASLVIGGIVMFAL